LRKLRSAKEPVTEEGLLYHIRCRPGDVAPYVLLPGDPSRVPRISKYWDVKKEVAKHREYVTHTGTYRGAPISATSTGIGGPSAAIAVEELLRAGARVLIRVGTSGALRKEIEVGSLVVSTGAIRLDGTTRQYVVDGYPAVASFEVVVALIEAAEEMGVKYHVGLTATTDSFYVGQGREGFEGFKPSWSDRLIEDLMRMNVLNFEMESAVIFTLANVYGVRAGAICAVLDNIVTGEFVEDAGVEDCIRVANEAVRILHEWDEEKRKQGRKFIYPKMLTRYYSLKRSYG